MNKKGAFPLLIPLLWFVGILILINIIGITTFTYRVSHSPWLWIILGIGVFILFQQSRKK